MIASRGRNRGPQSSDAKLFAPKWYPTFKEAIDDHSYLLGRGYGTTASIEVVGNRYRLSKRQRLAIMRISASEQEIQQRQAKELSSQELKGQTIEIDGFNLLILLEGALSGAYIFKCRDGLYRDVASVHGSYKRVIQTEQAIQWVGETLKSLEVAKVQWYLDSPVSNSGRLKSFILEIGNLIEIDWEVELVFNPDAILIESKEVVISSDGDILNKTVRWFNLGRHIIEKNIPEVNLIEC